MIQFPIYCIISGETSFFISDLLESIKTTKYFKFKLSAWTAFPAQISHPIYPWFLLSQRFFTSLIIRSDQIRSVAQSCPTLCDAVNRSTPGLPVHHQLLEFTQTHVHWVSDAIQPSHPPSSPSPLAPNPSQHQSLFQRVNSSHQVAKVLEFQL